MEPMKPKIKEGMFASGKTGSFSGRDDIKVEDLEIRPGGMLVQRRSTSVFSQISVAIPTIKVRVKFGSLYHEIRISSQASFGDLKKMLAEHTGVHHQDQKLVYKKKERDSKAFLDVAGVKNGSKIVLIEDITSRERRCLEMLKSARTEKALKSLQQISSEVDKLDREVKSLEAASSRGMKVAETDVDKLTEILMTKLVAFDGIDVNGELKLQKRMQEQRVQKYVEILDMLKLNNATASTNGGKMPLQQQDKSIGKVPIPRQNQPTQPKNRNVTEPMPVKQQQQQPLRHSESVVVTTKWVTFD